MWMNDIIIPKGSKVLIRYAINRRRYDVKNSTTKTHQKRGDGNQARVLIGQQETNPAY